MTDAKGATAPGFQPRSPFPIPPEKWQAISDWAMDHAKRANSLHESLNFTMCASACETIADLLRKRESGDG